MSKKARKRAEAISVWANSGEDVGPRDFLRALGFDKKIAAVGGDPDYVAEILDPVGIERFRDDYVALEADLTFGRVELGSPEYHARAAAMKAAVEAVIENSLDVQDRFLAALGIDKDES